MRDPPGGSTVAALAFQSTDNGSVLLVPQYPALGTHPQGVSRGVASSELDGTTSIDWSWLADAMEGPSG